MFRLNGAAKTCIVLIILTGCCTSSSTPYTIDGVDNDKYVAELVGKMTHDIVKEPCKLFPVVKSTLVDCSKSDFKPAEMCSYLSDMMDEVLDGTKPEDIDICKERIFLDTIYQKMMQNPCSTLATLKNTNCKESTIKDSKLCTVMRNTIMKIEKTYSKFATINLCNEIVTVSGLFIKHDKDGKSCSLSAVIKKLCDKDADHSKVGTFGCAVLAFIKPILDNEELGLMDMDWCDPLSYIMLICRIITNMPCTIFGDDNSQICEYFNIIKDAINTAIPGLKDFSICSTGEDMYDILKTLFTNPKEFGNVIKTKCKLKKTPICDAIDWFSKIPGFFHNSGSCKQISVFIILAWVVIWVQA